MVFRKEISLATRGRTDIIDITDKIRNILKESCIKNGILNVFVPGSTAGITTIEYESGLLQDLKEAIERIIPSSIRYRHDERWGDGNGFSHIRSALIGTSFSVPFEEGIPLLGTWQQIILLDFDIRPRNRTLIITIVGDGQNE